MSTNTDTAADNADLAGLPAFPGVRSARCPFDPPAEHADWRKETGLRRVLRHGKPMWAVSRCGR